MDPRNYELNDSQYSYDTFPRIPANGYEITGVEDATMNDMTFNQALAQQEAGSPFDNMPGNANQMLNRSGGTNKRRQARKKPQNPIQTNTRPVPGFGRMQPVDRLMTYDLLQQILQLARVKMREMYADDDSLMVVALNQDLDRAIDYCANRLYSAQEILEVAVSNSHAIVKAYAITNLCAGRVQNSRNIHLITTQVMHLPIDLAEAELNANSNNSRLDNAAKGDLRINPVPYSPDVGFEYSSPFEPGGEFYMEHPTTSNRALANDGSNVGINDDNMVDRYRKNAHDDEILGNAPSANTPFPQYNGWPANVTAVELLTFFPRWLKSSDVIERFVSNGATTRSITDIVDAHRETKNPAYDAYFHNVMVPRMRALGDDRAVTGIDYRKWNPSSHIPLPLHDPTRLDISGMRTYTQIATTLGKTVRTGGTDYNCSAIPFYELAQRIKRFPSGPDALNLTRCVEYARDHPFENWMWPDDFERMVTHVFGVDNPQGQIPAAWHLDAEAFNRWKGLPMGPGNRMHSAYHKAKDAERERNRQLAFQGVTEEDDTDEPLWKRMRVEQEEN